MLAHAANCVSQLERMSYECVQRKWGNVCSQMVKYQTAAMDICGPYDAGIHCQTAASHYAQMMLICRKWYVEGGKGDYRVGGMVRYDLGDGARRDLNIYHT